MSNELLVDSKLLVNIKSCAISKGIGRADALKVRTMVTETRDQTGKWSGVGTQEDFMLKGECSCAVRIV